MFRLRSDRPLAGAFPSVILPALLAALGVFSSARAEEPRSWLYPLAQAPVKAEFGGLGDEGELLFIDADRNQRRYEWDDFAYWGVRPDWRRTARVILADGGELAAEVVGITADTMVVRPYLFLVDVEIPLEKVRGVVYSQPADKAADDKLLERVKNAVGAADALLLRNGDVVSGVLQPSGGPGDDNLRPLEALKLNVGGRPVEAETEKVAALIVNPELAAPSERKGPVLWIGFKDGSLLAVRKLDQVQGAAATERYVHIESFAGLKLLLDLESFIDQVALLQTETDRLRYLSDMTPRGYKHVPFLSVDWPLGIDRAAHGGRLRSRGGQILKGVGMHSSSRVAFAPVGDFKRLEAELAIDAAAGRSGSVAFRVYLHDGSAWRPAYKSPVVRGGERPIAISLDVAEARGLLLLVDFADRGAERDLANWLNARLVR